MARNLGVAMLVAVAVLGMAWLPHVVSGATADDCSTVGTERQRAIAEGWNNIASADDLGAWYYEIGGKRVGTHDLMAMPAEERAALADQWVEDYGGTSELTAYRAALAACEAANTTSTDAITDDCSSIGTAQQQALAEGWTNIAYSTTLINGYYDIDGYRMWTHELMGLPEEERKLWANRWVAQHENGTRDLAEYREALAECEGSATADSPESESGNPERDAACQAFAERWLTEWASVDITDSDVEVLIPCRRDAGGRWFAPAGPDDERLPTPLLSESEIEETRELRENIISQIDAFERWLDTVAGDRAGRSMKAVIYDGYDPDLQMTKEDHPPTHASAYGELLQTFLGDPGNIALQRYVEWLVASHRAVADRLCVGINPYTCRALQNAVAPERWPWSLRDEFALSLHLEWALASGYAVTPPWLTSV